MFLSLDLVVFSFVEMSTAVSYNFSMDAYLYAGENQAGSFGSKSNGENA